MTIISLYTLYYSAGVILTLCLAIFIFFKHSFRYWGKLRVPFVPPKTIFGSFEKSTSAKCTLGEEMAEFYQEYKTKGHKFLGLYFFHVPIFMPIDTQLIKNILLKNFDHFCDRSIYCNEEDDPLSANLFSLDYIKWKHLRHKLTPAFSSGKLKQMFPTLVDCAEEFKTCLDVAIEKAEPIDIHKIMVQYAIDVIGSCAFGLDCNSFKNPDSDFVKYGSKMFHPEFVDRIKGFIAFLCPDISKFFKMRLTNKFVDIFFRKLVRDTIEYRDTNNVTRNDFMQLLIQLKNKGVLDGEELNEKEKQNEVTLTLDEATAQAFLFFVAGFETSATNMTFCMYEMTKHPDIQEKVRKEIVSVLKKHDGKINYDSVMEMHYMDRVIEETLRKHAPIMFLLRKVTKEYNIPDTDVTLQNNTLVFIPISALHHDSEYFPNPDEFNPDRFTEENKKTRPDIAYLPFGEGPRICIGLRFSMMETKVGLCRLLSHYRFSLNPKTDEPIQLDPKAFIRTVKNGVWLNAEKIQ